MASRSRLNDYFIDKNGISREVIQADICRYLGNDALVKPGEHEVRLPRPSFAEFWPQSLIPVICSIPTVQKTNDT